MIPNHDGQCHYGVISLNSIGCDALGEAVMSSCYETWDDRFRKMANAVTHKAEKIQLLVDDDQVVTDEQVDALVKATILLGTSMNLQNRDDIAEYKDENIEAIFYHDHNNMMITSSKYKTRANLCSPCYPGAGDLDNCNDLSTNVTYCLGPEWFEDGKMPYEIIKE